MLFLLAVLSTPFAYAQASEELPNNDPSRGEAATQSSDETEQDTASTDPVEQLATGDPKANTAQTPQAAEPAASDFSTKLSQAKETYFQGDTDDALRLLRVLQVRLLQGEEASITDKTETLIYLGEILHSKGDSAGARETFRQLLESEPEAPISPYSHPIEVIGLFEMVRREVQSELVPPPETKPLPWWGYLPLGAPQFGQRQPVRGAVYGGLQLGLGATSVGLGIHLANINDKNVEPNDEEWEERRRRTNPLRYGVQWPVTAGFYAVWLTSHLDGRIHWRKQQRTVFLPMVERDVVGVTAFGTFGGRKVTPRH